MPTDKKINYSDDSEINFDFVSSDNLEKKSISDISENKENINISNIFAKANSNVKEMTNIFQKNLNLKRQLEDKLKKFEQEKKEFEKKKELEYEKIKQYKKDSYEKLNQKKLIIEKNINDLKAQKKN